jgi:hypothetical protein
MMHLSKTGEGGLSLLAMLLLAAFVFEVATARQKPASRRATGIFKRLFDQWLFGSGIHKVPNRYSKRYARDDILVSLWAPGVRLEGQ